MDDVRAVRLEATDVRTSDPLGQGLVGLLVLVDHSEHDQEVVLLGHTVDVAHAGVVQQLAVGVEARFALCPVQVTLDREGGFGTQNSLQIKTPKPSLNSDKIFLFYSMSLGSNLPLPSLGVKIPASFPSRAK